jgi:hypothetical protein
VTIHLRAYDRVVGSHYHKLFREFLTRLDKMVLYWGFHGAVSLGCGNIVNFEERIEKQESSSIDKPIGLNSLIDLVTGSEPADDKAIFKQVHALRPHALVVAYIYQYRPESRYSADFLQEQYIHLAVVSFEVICVVSVHHKTVDSPLVSAASLPLLYSLFKEIVQSVI